MLGLTCIIFLHFGQLTQDKRYCYTTIARLSSFACYQKSFRTRKFTWKHLYQNIWTCLVLFFQNTAGCRFLLMLTMYFRLTNYTWMFCEGYYLHRLLANTFEEERSLAFILTIGWGKTFSLFQFLWYSKT